jgi:UDP-N-acetylglucosamine 2-epimerase
MQNILNDSSAVHCEIIVGTRPEAIKLAPVIKALRDGWASFFYHTYDSISYLQQTAIGLKNMGYTFVSPTAALGASMTRLPYESHGWGCL